MPDPSSQTLHVQSCLDRLARGDESARAELFERTCERLRGLARKMLRNYPRVHRWEETGDVLQNATLRFDRALKQMAVQTPRDFFGLATIKRRWQSARIMLHDALKGEVPE